MSKFLLVPHRQLPLHLSTVPEAVLHKHIRLQVETLSRITDHNGQLISTSRWKSSSVLAGPPCVGLSETPQGYNMLRKVSSEVRSIGTRNNQKVREHAHKEEEFETRERNRGNIDSSWRRTVWRKAFNKVHCTTSNFTRRHQGRYSALQ